MIELKRMLVTAYLALRRFLDDGIEEFDFLVLSAVIAYKVGYFHIGVDI